MLVSGPLHVQGQRSLLEVETLDTAMGLDRYLLLEEQFEFVHTCFSK